MPFSTLRGKEGNRDASHCTLGWSECVQERQTEREREFRASHCRERGKWKEREQERTKEQDSERETETERTRARERKSVSTVSRSTLLQSWGVSLGKREMETVGEKDVSNVISCRACV